MFRVLLLSLFATAAFAQASLTLSPTIIYFDYANEPITTANPTVVVGNTNTLAFQVAGGAAPYTLALTSGTLPAGLSFGGNVPTNISGIAAAPGTFTFTLTATDSSTPSQTATQNYTVVAVTNPLVAVVNPVGGVLTIPVGASSGQAPLYAQGGVAPYHWSLIQGTVPPGLSLSAITPAFADGTGVLSALTGTPTTPGTFSFTLQLQDSSPTPNTLPPQTFAFSVISLASFTDPKSGEPFGITSGPGGALWFTQQQSVSTDSLRNPIYGVESLSTAGAFGTEVPLTKQVTSSSGSLVYPFPQSITAGPDGNLWITDNTDGAIIQAVAGAPGVVVTLLSSGGQTISPTGVTSGGTDGGVWFSGIQGYSPGTGIIGRINPANPAGPTLYTVPNTTSYPTSIVQNTKDGNAMWFLDQTGPSIFQDFVVLGRLALPVNAAQPFQMPAGCQAANAAAGFASLDECVIPGTKGHVPGPFYGNASVGPLVQVDSQGTVWFATRDQIGSISMDGTQVAVHALPFADAQFKVTSIALSADGSVWYTASSSDTSASYIGRVTTSGATTTVTNFPLFPGAIDAGTTVLQGITLGPDGALWVTDSTPNKVLQFFPSLALNCSVSVNLEVGVPIPANASCTAVGGKAPYSYTFDTSSLPPGVTVSAGGVLSGTPTAPGSFTIAASDSSAPAQQATQIISIQAAPTIQLLCNFPASATAGQPFGGTCTTAGGVAPYTYTTTPASALTTLGLTGTPSTPTSSNSFYGYSVSGTLSRAAHGVVSFTITAADSNSPTHNTSQPQTVSVSVTPIPVSLTCNATVQALVGKPFRQTCFIVGGNPPYTFTATGLPAGFSIDPSTGAISGTAAAPSQSSVTVGVADSSGQTATQALTLSVIYPPLALVCYFPAAASTGGAYASTCHTYGGTAPYSYAVLSGTLPPGLTLNPANGQVSGTLTSAGPATFVLQVTDSGSPIATAQQIVSLFTQPTVLTIFTTTLPTPNSSLPYAFEPSIGGGTGPYSLSVVAGALPGGLQIPTGSRVITNIPGTPLTPGAYSFTLQATDAVGATATQALSGTVSANPLFQDFTTFALPGTTGANGITAGSDGALWFTTIDQTGGNLIGRIDTFGNLTTTPSSNALTQLNLPEFATGGDITAGTDGNMWIAQRDGSSIGQLSVSQTSQYTYLPPTPNAGPAQITHAPDGSVWFTEAIASQIGHVDAGGNFTEFPTPTASAYPLGIAAGPNNLIVFTESAANKIGYISEDGTISQDIPIPTANSLPTSIVLGPDNAFWFTEYGASKIGRLDFGGTITEIPVSSAPRAITLGADGALYFTETDANVIGRITILGAVTEIPVSDSNSGPTGISLGGDGNIWFTENNLSKIGRLSFIFAPVVTCTLPPAPLQASSAFSATCTATQGTPPYTFSASGSLPGVNIDPVTGILSGTLTTAGTFTFTVAVTDSSSPAESGQQAYTFTVTPLPLGLNCTVPTARLFTPYAGAGCAAVNGTPPYTYVLTSSDASLPPGVTFDPATGNLSGTPTTLGSYPITVQVTDASTPAMVVSQPATIAVEYGTVTSTGAPLLTLSAPPISVDPGGIAPALTLSVNEPLLGPLTGSIALGFTDSTLLFNTPAGYIDPALQFLNTQGTGTGLVYNFTIQPGTSSITLPTFNVGTVAGNISIGVTAEGLRQTGSSLVVPPATPVIEAGSVQFTNVTSTGFDLEFVATTATRTALTATVTMNASTSDQIIGQSTFVIDVSKVSTAWFASDSGLKYGGRFSLTIPFEFSGSVKAIGSATVSLNATAGNPSQPVSGSR